MFRTLKSNSPFSAPRDDTARASCGNGAKANSYHLFDLTTDMNCQLDLSSSNPDITNKLVAAYDHWWGSLYPAMIEHGCDEGTPEPLTGKARK